MGLAGARVNNGMHKIYSLAMFMAWDAYFFMGAYFHFITSQILAAAILLGDVVIEREGIYILFK